MVTGIISAITAICTLAALVLEAWAASSPQRKKEKRDEEIQQGRQDIADGSVNAVNDRIDKLLTEQSNPTGQQCRPVTAERISSVLRMVDPGGGSGQDTGKS